MQIRILNFESNKQTVEHNLFWTRCDLDTAAQKHFFNAIIDDFTTHQRLYPRITYALAGLTPTSAPTTPSPTTVESSGEIVLDFNTITGTEVSNSGTSTSTVTLPVHRRRQLS